MLFKAGGRFGKFIKPLIELVAKYFPKISKFISAAAKTEKFKGIAPFAGKILEALKNFAAGKSPEIIKEFKRIKNLTKLGKIGMGMIGGETHSDVDMNKQKQLEQITDNTEDLTAFLKAA